MKKFIVALAVVAALADVIKVHAQPEMPVTLPVTQVEVSQETGEFQFDILIEESESYAGMEFGVVCGPECEIDAIRYDREVGATGPVESDMTWFGFFDGEDSFTESMTITVVGTCQIGVDAELALKTVKKYIIGDNEYEEEEYLVDTKVKLSAVPEDTQVAEENYSLAEAEKKGVSISWFTVLCILGTAGIAGVLIYISFSRKAARGEDYEK